MDNLEGSVLPYLAIIKGSIIKSVTEAELLVLVSLLLEQCGSPKSSSPQFFYPSPTTDESSVRTVAQLETM